MKLREKIQLLIGPILILGSYLYLHAVFKYARNCTGLCNDTNDVWNAVVQAWFLLTFSGGLYLYLYRKNKNSISGIITRRVFQAFCLLAWINICYVLFSIGSGLIPVQM